MITAVHCTIFPSQQKRMGCGPTPKWRYEKTISGRIIRQKLSCKKLPNGDTKITPYYPPALIWLGLTNIFNEFHTAERIRISYIIQPKGAYARPGTYGNHGGYDIVLGKLERKAPTIFQPACVPKLSFKDVAKSKLAGYGLYVREKCITNSYGPSKSHFCSTKEELHKKKYSKKKDFKGKVHLVLTKSKIVWSSHLRNQL